MVTLQDNHSLRHLKIIVVKRQMIKIASLRMKCAPSRLTTALYIVQSLLPQIIKHPWKYYSTMIYRVSIFEISKFHFFTKIAEVATRASAATHSFVWIQLITSVHIVCFGRYFGEEHILRIMKVFQCVLCELMLHVFYVSWRWNVFCVSWCCSVLWSRVFWGAALMRWGRQSGTQRVQGRPRQGICSNLILFPKGISARHPLWSQLCKKVDAGECDKGRPRQKCLQLITIGTSSM